MERLRRRGPVSHERNRDKETTGSAQETTTASPSSLALPKNDTNRRHTRRTGNAYVYSRNTGLGSLEETGWQMYVRYVLSAVMHIACLGYIVHMMRVGGVLDIVHSYYDAMAPWIEPCGLLDSKEYVLLSERIVGAKGLVAGGIHVRGGIIAGTFFGGRGMNESFILKHLVGSKKVDVVNYGDLVVGPGVIDVHVHMNDPGRPEWETMHQATQAAAAGGVTMVVDMPLNSDPVTTNSQRVKEKVAIGSSRNTSFVQVGFWGGLVPGNADKPRVLKAIVNAGAFGFKAFMAPSGIDDFEKVSITDIEKALPYIYDLDVPLLVHAEVVDEETTGRSHGSRNQYVSWMSSRPPVMERKAIKQLIRALEMLEKKEKRNFRIHIAHIADADALALVTEAKRKHLPISVETCPHYLMFSDDMIKDGATEFKCAPPIRDSANRDLLRRAVLKGDIDSVSSDHSPSPSIMKHKDSGDFTKAWGGISGIQYTLPALWQSLLDTQSDVSPVIVHRVLSKEPASLIGLGHLKGKIRDGYHADLVVWNPDEYADSSVDGCYQTQKLSPYVGARMKGKVVSTIVRGSMVFDSKLGIYAQSCSSSLRKGSFRNEKKS